VLFTGLPAALAMLIPARADTLSRRLNRWLGVGCLIVLIRHVDEI
jgi:hypothetical protein